MDVKMRYYNVKVFIPRERLKKNECLREIFPHWMNAIISS